MKKTPTVHNPTMLELKKENSQWQAAHAGLARRLMVSEQEQRELALKLRIATRTLKEIQWWRYTDLSEANITDRQHLVNDTVGLLQHTLTPFVVEGGN